MPTCAPWIQTTSSPSAVRDSLGESSRPYLWRDIDPRGAARMVCSLHVVIRVLSIPWNKYGSGELLAPCPHMSGCPLLGARCWPCRVLPPPAMHLTSLNPSNPSTGRPSTPHLIRHNPGGDGGVWAAGLGQDWVANNAAPHIDFASLHAWPDNWVDTEQLVGDGSAEDGAGESSRCGGGRSAGAYNAREHANAAGGAPA